MAGIVSKDEVSKALRGTCGEAERTQQEAADYLGISKRRLRKLMVEYDIKARSRSEARNLGGVGEPNDMIPNVVCLPEIIDEIDRIIDPVEMSISAAEEYILEKGWRKIEVDNGGCQKSASMITPELILALVRTRKYREG